MASKIVLQRYRNSNFNIYSGLYSYLDNDIKYASIDTKNIFPSVSVNRWRHMTLHSDTSEDILWSSLMCPSSVRIGSFAFFFSLLLVFSIQLLFFLLLDLLLIDYICFVLFVTQIKPHLISSTYYHHSDITWDHLG
jgi:hypothetical protein